MTLQQLITINKSEQGVLSICLNRPDKQNALTQDMYFSMQEAIKSADLDDTVKVLVIEASGDHFSAGNDIADFLATDRAIEETGAVIWLRSIEQFTKPIVVAVKGNAVGVGTTCLFHCDLVIVADDSKFAMPFTQLGLSPEAGISLLLPKLVGYHKAAELLMLGCKFTAQEALDMGLSNRVVARSELESTVADLASQLANLPSESLRITKQLLKTEPEPTSERMTQEFQLFEKQLHSDTARAIFKKFLS